ncbi:MAG: hypothetical protein D6772_15395, partial [Bacteroidetes bacterium]
MSDNIKGENPEVAKAKINYKQAVVVAIIAIIPTIFTTYWTTKPDTDSSREWEDKYTQLQREYDALEEAIPERHEFSELSILLMDTYLRKYYSVPNGQTNS